MPRRSPESVVLPPGHTVGTATHPAYPEPVVTLQFIGLPWIGIPMTAVAGLVEDLQAAYRECLARRGPIDRN